MTELFEWTQAELVAQDLHSFILVAVFIVVFLEIHPFQDGNGRLSRILTTLLLLRAGYAYVPFSSLESVIENSKDAYHLALRQTQGTIRSDRPNWQPWLCLFLKSLHQQKARLEKKIKRERLILGDLPELSVRILELCRERGRVTVCPKPRKQPVRTGTRSRIISKRSHAPGIWSGTGLAEVPGTDCLYRIYRDRVFKQRAMEMETSETHLVQKR